ncbi:MAG: hypothetical protein ABJF88_06890 [Rhodothermales bacterium]
MLRRYLHTAATLDHPMIDWNQVRALVGAQLRLDLRHPKTGALRTSRALLTVVSYGLSSFILALSLRPHAADIETVLFVGLSFACVLAAFAVVGTYDELMGRPADHAWALTLPASEATHYVARLVNIGLLVAVMSVSTALPLAWLAGTANGIGEALAVGGLVVGTMVGVTLVVLAVIWGLTLGLSHRVLKPVLTAVRAGLVGALVLGYQWVGTQPQLTSDAPWWPPRWVIDGLWLSDGIGGATLGLAALGLGLAVCFGFVFPDRYFALLQRMADGEQAQSDPSASGLAPNRLERLLVRAPESRAAFGFTVAALRSDALVRGRVWPAALLAFVFAAFGWWTGGLGDLFVHGAENVLTDPSVQMHLSVLVVLLFSAQTLVQSVQFSAHERAAWVFDTLPMRSGRGLQIGAQSALLFRVLVPLHLALWVVLSLAMPLGHAALHAGFWLALCALVTRAQALFYGQPPFSRRSDRFSMAERFVPLLVAVPASLLGLLLQTVAFASVPSAVLMLIGIGLLHSALGRAPSLRRAAPTLPEWNAPPVPAEV